MTAEYDNRNFYAQETAYETVRDEQTEEVRPRHTRYYYDNEWDVEVEYTHPRSWLLPKKQTKTKLLLPKPLTKPIPIYTPSFITLCKPGVTKAPKPARPFDKPVIVVKIEPIVELAPVKAVNTKAKTLPCKFGKDCRRGDKCEFAHNADEIVPTVCNKHPVLCDSCLYFHPMSETAEQYRARLFGNKQPVITHSLERTRMCKFGLKCKRADCKFAHTPSELRVAPCMYGMQCSNWRCPYLHPDETEVEMKDRLKQIRLTDLSTALTEQGLEYRQDSHLCQKFVDGTLEECWDLDKVVERMAQMKFLFEYTNFPTFYPAVKNRMTFDQAEQAVMRMHGGVYRKPWLH